MREKGDAGVRRDGVRRKRSRPHPVPADFAAKLGRRWLAGLASALVGVALVLAPVARGDTGSIDCQKCRLPCPVVEWASLVQATGQATVLFQGVNDKNRACCEALAGVLSALAGAGASTAETKAATDACGLLGAGEGSSVNQCFSISGTDQGICILIAAEEICGPLLISPARTLSEGETAVSTEVAHAVFDKLNGERLPHEERIDGWFSWLMAAYGVSDSLEVAAVVPVSRLDVPEIMTSGGTIPAQRSLGVGDALVRVLYRLPLGSDKPSELSGALGVLAEVRAPTGDEDELMGTGHWAGRLGLIGDLSLPPRFRRLVPIASIWAYDHGGRYGWGASAETDFVFGHGVSIMAKVVGTYNDRAGEPTYDYLDGFLGIRLSSWHPSRIWKYGGVYRTDVTLTLMAPINDDGPRASRTLMGGLLFTFR